jgi:hypothetical protein
MGVHALVFIRNGANLSHFFRQMPMRQKEKKYSKFLTVCRIIGPSFDSLCGAMLELRLNLTESKILHKKTRHSFLTVYSKKSSKLTVIFIIKLKTLKHYSFLILATRTSTTEDKMVLRYEKSGYKLDLLSIFNSAASKTLKLKEIFKQNQTKLEHYGYEMLVLRQITTKDKYF